MGDRANIKFIDSGWPKSAPVFLYSHSNGYRIHEIAAVGVQAAIDLNRQSDSIYATRIAVQKTLTTYNADDDGTGWGLSGAIGDGEENLIVVDWGTQTVWREASLPTSAVSFADFVANPLVLGVESH